jgi:omega-amidase
MKVTTLQMDIYLGEPEKNRRKLISQFKNFDANQTDVVLLPELWTTGYALSSLEDIAETINDQTVSLLKELATLNNVTIIAGSIAFKKDDGIYNTMLVIDNKGNICCEYSKVHLFKLMDEHRYLSAGENDSFFEVNNTLCSGFICYDIRFPQWMRKHAEQGAEVFFICAEWPSQRKNHWRALLVARAIENQAYIVACNRVGHDENNSFSGGSLVINPQGTVLLEGTNKEEILQATLHLSKVQQAREEISVFADQRKDLY